MGYRTVRAASCHPSSAQPTPIIADDDAPPLALTPAASSSRSSGPSSCGLTSPAHA